MKIPFEYQWNEIYKSLFLIISYITKNLDSLKNEILLKSIINMVKIFKIINRYINK